MYTVVKRDGSTAEFDINKIIAALHKAFEAQGRQSHPSVIELLALKVTADFESKIKEAEDKLAKYEDKYYSRFSKMEVALSKLESSTSSITAMLGQ